MAILPKILQRAFGYDVVADSGNRRRDPLNALRSEDAELDRQKRQKLLAIERDALRNFSVCRWAMGKHLDFVSTFSFASQTKTSFDTAFQDRMAKWMNEKDLCDIAGRHTFPRMLRMAEARAAGDGDHLLLMLEGNRLQQIESDRIRTYREMPGDKRRVVQGCVQNQFGKNIAYQIHRRGERGSGFHFQSEVDARHCLFHAYYPSERADQTRGVGLITSGLADFIDAYEWTGMAKAVEKVRAAFGVIFKGNDPDGHGTYTPLGNGKYDVEMGRGPFQLEMEGNDSVEFLSNDTPGGNTVAFFNACIGFGLKSLDIPLCFFDETLTNFFGQRAQFILYLKSCMQKRENLRANILNPMTKWLARSWVADGSLMLPPNGSIENLPFRWHPAGTPYWNPIQEVTAQLMAIRGGLDDYENVYLETTGRDWFAMIDRLAEQQAYIRDKKVILDEALAPVMAAMLLQDNKDNPLGGLPTAPDNAVPDTQKRGNAA
jgi:capsid protein